MKIQVAVLCLSILAGAAVSRAGRRKLLLRTRRLAALIPRFTRRSSGDGWNQLWWTPDSARIEWDGDPKCVDLGKNGEHLYGWLVNFTINSRNRFGSYTGKQKHGALDPQWRGS